MSRLLDEKPLRFSPIIDDDHHYLLIGANLHVPYTPPNAKCILVQSVVKDVRYTLDGTTPTATIGFVLVASAAPILIEFTERIKLKFFGTDATSVLQFCFGE